MVRHMPWRIVILAVVGMLVAVSAVPSVGHLQAQPAPVDEFVPLDQIPPEDQLPAAPLLVASYMVVWVLALGYLWSIWRRMATVERELGELSRRVDRPD